jgi:amicyanin
MKTRHRLFPTSVVWKSAIVGVALVGLVALPGGVMAGPPHDGATVGVIAAATGSASSPRIEIAKHKFSLPSVTVPVGGTVTWVNHDEDVHTVVSTAGAFRSPGLETDETYAYKFTKPGVYQYFCTLHPLMVGKVVVK